MLDNLLQLVKQYAGSAIITNPAIPNERNDEAIETAGSSIFNGFKNAASNGNITDIISMFNSESNVANSGIAQNIKSGFIGNLMQKFGLDANAASGIASNLIPTVLQQLVHKTNDTNDSSFDLQSIISKVGGGNIDVQSLIGQFTGNQTSNAGVGSIVDSLKGLFGK
ncbi:MAG: hypothetical protein H7101_13525 [Deinococcales bacterium]|nr:hypothetical protein [Chitinophagaceae bacterium]